MDYLPYIRTTIQLLPYRTSMHVHFVHCEIFDVEHCNITQRCNNEFYYVLLYGQLQPWSYILNCALLSVYLLLTERIPPEEYYSCTPDTDI